jgi:tetratricopeptide (TPR) repeat protein
MKGTTTALQDMFAAACQHQKAGRLDAAEQLFRQILVVDPHHADSLHLLGVIAHKNGNDGCAIDLIAQAITLNGTDPSYHSNLGNLLRNQGRANEAAAFYRRAMDLRPNYAEALNNRGKMLATLHRPAEALAIYDRALALKPDYAEALNNRGNALGDLHRPAEALASFNKALALQPNYAEAFNNRGNALRALNRPADALASYDRALALKANDPVMLLNRGNALRDLNRSAEALASYDKVLALQPDHAEALNNRAVALRDLNRSAEALASYDRLLALKPDYAEAYSNKGIILTELGRFDEANNAIETATRISPGNTRYGYLFTLSKRSAPGDRHLRAMETLAQGPSALSIDEQIYLHFGLGKAFADIGNHADSFRHLVAGNALKRSQTMYDEAATLRLFEHTQAVFTRDLMHRSPSPGEPSPVPVFILGMPRSGSTLVEQILASHPKVHGAGEIDDLEKAMIGLTGLTPEPSHPVDIMARLSGDQLRELGATYLARIRAFAPQAGRITNKTPENFRLIGLIHRALPNARIIHTRRDPVDTCLSCFSHLFTRRLHYTYDLAELGRYYRAYETMMAHWRSVLPRNVMLDLQYEDLVNDLEGQGRRIVAHCGLEWDAGCLDFHRTQRVVRTASMSQVRQPIYKSSVGRWRALEPLLGPLLAELYPLRPPAEPMISGDTSPAVS